MVGVGSVDAEQVALKDKPFGVNRWQDNIGVIQTEDWEYGQLEVLQKNNI